ncbi:MAG: beta-lactamase family protein [Bradyrhizobium sp.]|uniref:serine hydrolase domain-containing protein n=1 Tax=Bradyrhizobium sp. TaxID=376 RepID=UPI0025C3B2A8|nr:serine hydrolase domain-containing protein [Bradyrhizobium sp.]MBI5265287.1 beta-lactamase family protein [Bradyrhizobium sp.]
MRRSKPDAPTRRRFVIAALALFLAAVGATVAKTRDAGTAAPPRELSRAKLERVGEYLSTEVATGRIPGAVVLIQQHGRPIYFRSFGVRDVATKAPMTADTIFRLYSMSKAVTSVAVMMLVDDGKLSISDPLAKYIPAFADVKVALVQPDGTLKLEPLKRPITIQDLLRHTSGITYGFYGDTPVRKLYARSDLFDGDFDNAAFVERLARLPLAEQPGTLWDYGHSTDVLGRVVEVVSGKSLFQFEKERLIDPLGMSETAFYLADNARRGRVAEPLPKDRFDRPVAGITDPILPRRWESGGAGMIGTIGDYARFAQMLLNGGRLDGRRYLKPETVALMISDHIGPETGIGRDAFYFPGPDSGFGLGFAVRTVAKPPFPFGEYRWDGVAGTFFFVDPGDDLFAICMMQSPSQRPRIQAELKKLIYEALER